MNSLNKFECGSPFSHIHIWRLLWQTANQLSDNNTVITIIIITKLTEIMITIIIIIIIIIITEQSNIQLLNESTDE
jgi:hypothetical protein